MKNMEKSLVMASALAVLDQLSKYLILKYLKAPFLFLEYTENSGVAFGIPLNGLVALFLSLILLVLIIYIAAKELDLKIFINRFALSLILGGALGNIIDRLIHGYVVDFIAIWKWPNFNLADSFITVGILLIILFYAKVNRSKTHSL